VAGKIAGDIMKFFELSENEIINIEVIDGQHKTFVKQINELYELLGQDKPETIKYLLNQFTKEVKVHFETEENFMKKYSYESYYSHKLEHDRFLNKFLEFTEEVTSGKENLNLEKLKSAKTWFFNHFELNDKKLGVYLKEKNIK